MSRIVVVIIVIVVGLFNKTFPVKFPKKETPTLIIAQKAKKIKNKFNKQRLTHTHTPYYQKRDSVS